MGTRSSVAASVVGLLFTASAWELGPGVALLLGLVVARASADIARARSILNRRRPPRSRSLTDLFRWLSWELFELPDEADEAAPADDLLTRILCASLDGRIQLLGLMAAVIILFGASPLVSADSRTRLGLAGLLLAGASLAHLPARARALGAQVRKRSNLLARVAASGSVLLFALATALSSMPAVILGLLAAAVAFEAIRRTSLGLIDSAPISHTPQGVEATPEEIGAQLSLDRTTSRSANAPAEAASPGRRTSLERAISVLAGVVTALLGAFLGGIAAVMFPLLMDIQQREVLFIVGALVGAVPGVLIAVKGFQGRPL